MAQVVGKLMAPGGKYIKNGEEKTSWIRCGVLLQTDNGFRVKIESIPLGIEPGGLWLSVFEDQEKPQGQGQGSAPTTRSQPSQEPLDDEMPF
jgi:hypothetical protein